MSSAATAGPTGPAKTHALLLPDVMFEIILYLDFHTLICCQSVCRTWSSVISQSREARKTLFLAPSHTPFDTFKAAEKRDIALGIPAAFETPQHRIPQRPEFRALFNPWLFTHDCDPIRQHVDGAGYLGDRRMPPTWRFTDRVSSGRLDFCFTAAELMSIVDGTEGSWSKMFLTQPPVKRVLITVQGGYMVSENCDVEKDEGVKIGDVVSYLRATRAAKSMRGKTGNTDFTTVDLAFDEHFTGVRFLPLQKLVTDSSGNAVPAPC